MSADLSGTTALVTGASSGIGEATARALAERGASVALLARRHDRLLDLAQAIRDQGGSALALETDVTDAAQAALAIRRTLEHFGRLDIVVNNAGTMHPGPLADAQPGEVESMLAVNITGVLNVTRAAIPHLVDAAASSARGVSDLVNISSTAGRVPRANNAVYSLTKFGIGALSESLRQELLGSRVRVAVIEPGKVATEITTHIRQESRDRLTASRPDIEPMRPEDIADAVLFTVTRDRRVAVNEILVRASEQTW
jgi:NADP-dependent 3-hydroxy acid dehydrogenase YdfG